MKAAAAVVLALLACGCMSGGNKDSESTHYVSSKPLLGGCNNRTTVQDRESCYVDAALSSSTVSLCAEVGNDTLRNICYQKMARKTLDPAVCVNIKNDDVRYTDCMTSSSR